MSLGRKRDGKVMILGGPGGLGRVPACTGAHFRHLLILLCPVGKGFLKENPGFPEELPEKGRDLNMSKNNETPHANSARSTVADIIS